MVGELDEGRRASQKVASQWLRAQVNLSDKVRDPETNKYITRKWFCEKYPDKCQQQAPSQYRQDFENTPAGINQQIQGLGQAPKLPLNPTPAERRESLKTYKHPSGNQYGRGTQVAAMPSGTNNVFRHSNVNGGEFNNVRFENAKSSPTTKLRNVSVQGGDWSGVEFHPRSRMRLQDSYNKEVRNALDDAGWTDDNTLQALVNFYSEGSSHRQRNLFGLGKRLNRKDTHNRIKNFQRNHRDLGKSFSSDPTRNYRMQDMQRLSDQGWGAVQDYAIRAAQQRQQQPAKQQRQKKHFGDLLRTAT